MPKPRSGHLIIGVGLGVMGFAVMVIALSRQAEQIRAEARAAAAAYVAPSASSAGPASVSSGNGIGETRPSSGHPGDDPDASLADGARAVDADGGSDGLDGGDGGDARVFKFFWGGAGMSREEQLRLSGVGKAVARHPTAKLTIEAFGDTPGTDSLNVGIAKHRQKVTQSILARAGLSEDRMTLVTSDLTSDPRLARSIRLTSTPSLTEVERP
jgi:outer membrane protein OmpA-like peptidoglycan-associated protein